MTYNLTEYQIEEILREGEFNKEKYTDYMSLVSFNLGDSIYDYEQKHIVPLIKDKNKLYDMITNCDLLRDSTAENIFDDIEDCINCAIAEIERLIERGEVV
jgi:hypothetical protein